MSVILDSKKNNISSSHIPIAQISPTTITVMNTLNMAPPEGISDLPKRSIDLLTLEARLQPTKDNEKREKIRSIIRISAAIVGIALVIIGLSTGVFPCVAVGIFLFVAAAFSGNKTWDPSKVSASKLTKQIEEGRNQYSNDVLQAHTFFQKDLSALMSKLDQQITALKQDQEKIVGMTNYTPELQNLLNSHGEKRVAHEKAREELTQAIRAHKKQEG